MNVHLTFDIEIWCNGWDKLDESFAASYERYVYGKSRHGQFALPKTLEILNRNGLKGVFFVEPLFAARVGIDYLSTIVALILDAGQEVQLHLHPEWTDEISPPVIQDVSRKRQHLSYYTQQEQTELIAFARNLLEKAGCESVTAFRAGSFAANRDTFAALRHNGILIDSSLNSCYPVSGADLRDNLSVNLPAMIDGVSSYPVMVFTDGTGRARPAHIGACSFGEIKEALWSAKASGHSDFVMVSHNFEMLKPDSSTPSWTVVRRFEELCAYLAREKADFPVTGYTKLAPSAGLPDVKSQPVAKLGATMRRHVEQLISRIG